MENHAIRLIKKYPNRRLYDTETRAYITLQDIRLLIFKHINFKVIDARTQKDLTQNTLLQIIADQEINGSPIFSNEQLENFIRLYHDQSQALFGRFLQEGLELFIKQKDLFFSQWKDTVCLQREWLEKFKNASHNHDVE